ncbi:MAG: bifunctional UDP-sugar hydrolase/5'-nucleotidase [bacterium]
MKKINFRFITGLLIALFFGHINAFANQTLIILHTNDIHGRLAPIDYSEKLINVGGQARRNSIIKKIKSENKNVLVLDGGDIAQGSLYYSFYGPIPNIEYMNNAGYDASAVGNHEFDRGINDFQSSIKCAKFPFLASNLHFKKHKELNCLIKDYLIKDVNGFKIGIIGVTTPEFATKTKAPDDTIVLSPEKAINHSLKELKNKTDYNIVLSHMGIDEEKKIAAKLKNIDLIVGGHSHTMIQQPIIIENKQNKTFIVQDWQWGMYIGELTLDFNDNNKLNSYKYELIPVDKNSPEDKTVKDSVDKLTKEIKEKTAIVLTKLNQPLDARRSILTHTQSPAGQLMTMAIKDKYPQVDIVLQNNAGIRADKIFKDKLSLGDLMELYPFENNIILTNISGKELKSVLETSSRSLPTGNSGYLQAYGVEYKVDTTKQPQLLSKDGKKIIKEGKRVSDIKINGIAINNKKEYLVAINDYMANGGDGYNQFKKDHKMTNTGVYTRDIIIEYIKKHSPLTLETQEKNNR